MSREMRPGVVGARPLEGLAVFTLFRGEPAQILKWSNYHLNAGAAQLYVALDRPTAEMVEALPEHDGIHWHVINDGLWNALYPPASSNVERKQVDAFRSMARRAQADGHTYLAFVDADELIVLTEPFGEILRRDPDAVALRLSVREMWYDDDADDFSDPFGASLAFAAPGNGRRDWRREFGWRAQYLRDGMLGHRAGKSVYRLPLAGDDLTVHAYRQLKRLNTVAVPSSSGGILHFDCGSLGSWRAKWGGRIHGTTLATGLAPRRQAQQRLFSYALRRSPEYQGQFFRDFFSLDAAAKDALREEGLIEHVDLKSALDGPLSIPSVEGRSIDEVPVTTALTWDRVDFQFALVCDQRFVKPTFATMTSVLAQLGERGSVRFVVLGDGLSAADRSRLRSLQYTDYDVQVVVHDITAELDRDVGTEDQKRATFGRIYFADYLPPQRTVYLDGDVLATRDFSELFTIDLQGACLGGVPDSAALRLVADPAGVPIHQRTRLVGITGGEPLEYLNGGVLILDLDNPDFRPLSLDAKALVVLQGRSLKQRDQDAMNIAFTGRKFRLESTYNYMTQFYASDRCLDGELIRRKYDAADASLIHFSGRIKPWESPDDEFYNGLYRKLVHEAEDRVGVSCDFYFSRPSAANAQRPTAGYWADVLSGDASGRESTAPDIALIDLCDTDVYLRLSTGMVDLLRGRKLHLVGDVEGRRLFSVPLAEVGPVQVHLSGRVGRGVRRLPLDLVTALAPVGGMAERLEIGLVDAASESDFVRSVCTLENVVAGSRLGAGLLEDMGAEGTVERLADGWLSGWYRRGSGSASEFLSLYLDGELVARRVADVARPDLPKGVRGFKFNIARLRNLGYGERGDISLQVSGSNRPLDGGCLSQPDLSGVHVYDRLEASWHRVEQPRPSPATPIARLRSHAGRVKRRLQRMVAEQRGR